MNSADSPTHRSGQIDTQHLIDLTATETPLPSPINLDTLRSLRASLDRTRFRSLLRTFLDSAGHRIGALASAVENQEYELVRELCHSIEGSAASFGARTLAELVVWLHELATDENLAGAAPAVVDRIEQEFAAVRRVCTDLLDEDELP